MKHLTAGRLTRYVVCYEPPMRSPRQAHPENALRIPVVNHETPTATCEVSINFPVMPITTLIQKMFSFDYSVNESDASKLFWLGFLKTDIRFSLWLVAVKVLGNEFTLYKFLNSFFVPTNRYKLQLIRKLWYSCLQHIWNYSRKNGCIRLFKPISLNFHEK